MNALGRHILVEYYDCQSEILNDCPFIAEIMNKAAILAGATVVEKVFHTFNPYGVSGTVVIAESHLAIHTWPEYGYASVDLFTCGESVDPWIAFKFLKKNLGAMRAETREVRRGVLDLEGKQIHHKPVEFMTDPVLV